MGRRVTEHDDDITAPGRPPDPPEGREIKALEELADALLGLGGKMGMLIDQLRAGRLSPAARLTLAAELRESGNNLRAAAVLLEGPARAT